MVDDAQTEVAFAGPVVEWRGSVPYFFIRIPDEHIAEVRRAAKHASYGWGVVPVVATANTIPFRTSLFPRDGGYLLPIREAVRRAAGLALGDLANVRLMVAP